MTDNPADLVKLRATLQALVDGQTATPRSDLEEDHYAADEALLAYVDDPEVRRLFGLIEKWYS